MTISMHGRFVVEARIAPMQEPDKPRPWRRMGTELDSFALAVQAIDWIARMPGVWAVAIRQLELVETQKG